MDEKLNKIREIILTSEDDHDAERNLCYEHLAVSMAEARKIIWHIRDIDRRNK